MKTSYGTRIRHKLASVYAATAELPDGFTAGPGIRGEGCGWEIHSDGATYWLRVYDGWATRPLVKIV
jgi:hypothetical protein